MGLWALTVVQYTVDTPGSRGSAGATRRTAWVRPDGCREVAAALGLGSWLNPSLQAMHKGCQFRSARGPGTTASTTMGFGSVTKIFV